MDSTAFLAGYEGTIDLLYHDGFDSLPGQEEPAARKQLDEIVAALPHLALRAVVLLDDAALPDEGKTRYSSAFLADHGFELRHDAYQRLFVRSDVSAPAVQPSTRAKKYASRLIATGRRWLGRPAERSAEASS
jgi:hypothetical protein